MLNRSRLLAWSTCALLSAFLLACSGAGGDGTLDPTVSTTPTTARTSSPATASSTPTSAEEPTAAASGTPTGTPIVPADGSQTTVTDVVSYRPEPPGDIAPQQADCFSESLAAAGRSDTRRCSVGNEIFDPCFAVDATHLMCEPDPVRDLPGTYIVIEVPLPTGGGLVEPQVWLLQLADGTVCGFATGATAGTEDKRLNYSCTNGEWILGFPEAGEPWTAEFIVGHMSVDGLVLDERHIEKVATVWR
ncbi:MAG: hypothetical protein WEA81_04700 [Dehalococcoidia bacterium]